MLRVIVEFRVRVTVIQTVTLSKNSTGDILYNWEIEVIGFLKLVSQFSKVISEYNN